MTPLESHNTAYSRRQFFRKSGTGLGMAALASLLGQRGISAAESLAGINGMLPQIAPKAKRVIYISLIGAPSQLDLFDYKPELKKRFKEDLNGWLKEQGERLTGMTSGQPTFPLAPSIFKFQQHGQSGAWVSELLPWTAKMVDDLCIIKSMHTDAINHEPANQLICTGSMQAGKASLGSWLSYGLGSMNEELPSFVVLHATHTSPFANVQAISSRLWGSGYLAGKHSGVALRSLIGRVVARHLCGAGHAAPRAGGPVARGIDPAIGVGVGIAAVKRIEIRADAQHRGMFGSAQRRDGG